MTTPRFALLSFAAGSSLAVAWMGAIAVRAAYSITKQHHWSDLRKL